MKISKVSTGNKLKIKTFGELKKGDTVYFPTWADYSMEDVTYTLGDITHENNIETNSYTDLNPDKKETINCDLVISIDNKKNEDLVRWVPSYATYIIVNDGIITTDKELMFQLVKKYNVCEYLLRWLEK